MRIDRVKHLLVANVRGIPACEDGTGQQFDLDAPLVLLSGPNGYGKTSLCDALSFGLNGPAIPDKISPFFAEETQGKVEATTTGDCDHFEVEITKDSRDILFRGRRESQNGMGEDWTPTAENAALPALASAFFQDRLSIDLNVVVPHLKVDLPDVSGLRAKLRDYRKELPEWLEHHWPQAEVEPEDQLLKARRQVVAELVEYWSECSFGVPVKLDSLALKQNNPPKNWPGRLRLRVQEIAESWKMSVALTKGSTISDSLEAFRKIVRDRFDEQVSAMVAQGTSVKASLQWPQRLLEGPTTVTVLRGSEGVSQWTGSASEPSSNYPLPLDEPAIMAVDLWLDSLEKRRLDAEQRGKTIRQALVWFAEERGSRTDIVAVLRALAGDGVDWSQPPELPGIAPTMPPVADEWLQAHIVDHQQEHRAAADAFEGWRADLDDAAGEQESLAQHLSHRRIQGKLLLTICRRLVAEKAYQGLVSELDDFTTAVDLAQIPRVALLLRRLTYAAPEGSRRQIIVSTHHEDLTNRLLELLAPPPGEKLRAIQFVGWTAQRGPVTETYEASGSEQSGEQVDKRKQLFGTLLDSGVEWITRASGVVPSRSGAVEDVPDSL